MSDKTVLDAIIEALRKASSYHRGAEGAPAALLWTDHDGQWLPLIELLRAKLPELLVYGAYDPALRQGPAIWLKCAIARTVEVSIPADVIPIVYLPRVNRLQLRNASECPEELQPLVELQYRGAVWTQRNSKDWTLEAFFGSEDGLGLELGLDEETRRALRRSLASLAVTPVSALAGRHLAGDDFDHLIVADEKRDLLQWIALPAQTQEGWKSSRWQAFVSRCKREYGFDPEHDGAIVAAERLGLQESAPWRALWVRFCEAPSSYPGLQQALDNAVPTGRGKLLFNREPWPSENDKDEAALREAFKKLGSVDTATARQTILTLERGHAIRRKWVWARLDRAELARALEPLSVIAGREDTAFAGSLEEFVTGYVDRGFEVDAAALRALQLGKTSEDRAAISTALNALYGPWLQGVTHRFQELVERQGYPATQIEKPITPESGECLLFVDGLRFDVGQSLKTHLEERAFRVKESWHWAAYPTVTPTAKPFSSPLRTLFVGQQATSDTFSPILKDGGDELSTARFRKLLGTQGIEFIEPDSVGASQTKGWTESGKIDTRGHELQGELALHITHEVERIVERVGALLSAGWKKVRVITDHGWLLLPGGLPKVDLPTYLVESRWARCARVRDGARVKLPSCAWVWNEHVQIASAPGPGVFIAGNEYAHGGLSPQECIIPFLVVTTEGAAADAAVKIESVEWRGLRCRVRLVQRAAGVKVDIRLKPADAKSSVADSLKASDADGLVSLVVPDDELAGSAAVVVALDAAGSVIAKQNTVIGGE